MIVCLARRAAEEATLSLEDGAITEKMNAFRLLTFLFGVWVFLFPLFGHRR